MASWFEPVLDRCLTALVSRLADADKRRASITRWCTRLRWCVRLISLGYAVLLVAVWLLMKFVGEGNLTLAFLLYSPQSIWLLPIPVLLVMALLLDAPSLIVCLASAVLCVCGFLEYNFGNSSMPSANERALTVLTFNRGESGETSLQPFKNATKPHVLMLPDATARSIRYVKSPGYEEFLFGDDIGEFSVVSRFHIKSKELISHHDTPVAARFTLDWEGRLVVLYTLHLPTPRFTLSSLRRGAFLWGVLGVVPGTSWAGKKESYESFFHNQIDIVRTVLARVEAETEPCILGGDFNAPGIGYIQHLATRKLTDAHAIAGSGSGHTFPGTTRNPLSLGGPWMRLDKLLSNSFLQPVWCKTEPDRASQHRSVAASFVLKP